MRWQRLMWNYYRSLQRDFHRQFLDVLYHYGPETVHDLRVNMKKQVSFYHMLEVLDDHFVAEEAFHTLKNLYKAAAKVRNVQVEKTLVSRDEAQLALDHTFSAWLVEQEEKQRQRLEAFEADYSLAPFRHMASEICDRIRLMPDTRIKERLPDYFANLLTRIRDILENMETHNLHQLRKEVKELFYSLELLQMLAPSARLPKSVIKTLDKAQKWLGQWHDHEFILQRIESKQEPCPEELKKKLIEDREALREKIYLHLPDWIDTIGRLETALQKAWEEGLPVEPSPKLVQHFSYFQRNIAERYH